MKKLFFACILVLVIYFPLLSQFNEGYIINNNNDTINGSINFEGSINNSDHCSFRLRPNNEIQTFKPGEINAFRFLNGKFFTTQEILVDNKLQKVFIEWLIKGRASILSYATTVNNVRFFLLMDDSSIVELTNTTQEFVQNKTSYERKRQEYKGTLSFYFRDCPSLKPKIEAMSLNSKSLIKIAKEFNEETSRGKNYTVFEQNSKKLNIDIGVSASLINSTVKLKSDYNGSIFPVNIPGFGVLINLNNLPYLSRKFSAKINVLISSPVYIYDTTGLYSPVKDDRLCSMINARIPLQLVYKFTQNKINPYVSAGLTVNVRFGYKQYDPLLITNVLRSRGVIYNSGVAPFLFGINAGFGIEYLVSPKFGIDLGYDFEYGSRFFGSFTPDKSFNRNNIVHIGAYFKIKNK